MTYTRSTAQIPTEELSTVVDQMAFQGQEGPKEIMIERDGLLTPVTVSEEECKNFLAQFDAQEPRDSYRLSFWANVMPELDDLRVKFKDMPEALSLIEQFASGNNHLSMRLTPEDVISLDYIAQVVNFLSSKSVGLKNNFDQGLKKLVWALGYAKSAGILPELGSALHKMVDTRNQIQDTNNTSQVGEIFYVNQGKDGPTFGRRYLNTYDLAAQTLLLVSIEEAERINDSPLGRLETNSAPMQELAEVKQKAYRGAIIAIYMPEGMISEAAAYYDDQWQRVVLGKIAFEKDLFEFNPITKGSMAQTIYHELRHAMSRFSRRIYGRSSKLEEAYAHSGGISFAASRYGMTYVEYLYWHNPTSLMNGQMNREGLVNMKRFTGIDLATLYPSDGYDYHREIVKELKTAIKNSSAPNFDAAAEKYALFRSLFYLVGFYLQDKSISQLGPVSMDKPLELTFVEKVGDEYLPIYEYVAFYLPAAGDKINSMKTMQPGQAQLRPEDLNVKVGRAELREKIKTTLKNMAELIDKIGTGEIDDERARYYGMYSKLRPMVEFLLNVYMISAKYLNDRIDDVLKAHPEISPSTLENNRLEGNLNKFFRETVLPFYLKRYNLGFHYVGEAQHTYSNK